MSYLDVPRLHFFGAFTANPSARDISDAKKQIVLKWLASLPGSSSGSG